MDEITCQEFRHLTTNVRPGSVSAAIHCAVNRHYESCESCRNRLRSTVQAFYALLGSLWKGGYQNTVGMHN